MSVARSLPSDLLLTEQDALLFYTWQQQYTPGAMPGAIRSALDYHRFIHRNDPTPCQTFSLTPPVALGCGHELHPSEKRIAGYCPICEIKISLEFMDAVAAAIIHAGGPWHHRKTQWRRYGPLRKGWHMARLQHEHMMAILELAVKQETAWEEQNPFKAIAARKTNTGAKASRMGVMERKYPALVAPDSAVAEPRGLKRKRATDKKKKKCVVFAPQGTCRRENMEEVIDINFGLRRPRAQYARTSTAYQPGAHAAPFKSGWEDTSNCIFKRDHVDFRNLKVFATDCPSQFYRLKLDPKVRPGIQQGLLNSHPASRLIARTLRKSVDEFDAKGRDVAALLSKFIKMSDAVVVLYQNDTVLDVRFSWLPDVEAEQQDDAQKRDQYRWTCCREAIGANRIVAKSVAYEPEADKELQSNPWKRLKTDEGSV